MNLNIIKIIIGREYLTKVKKKSFFIMTFLGPIFFAAMMILPSLIMMFAKDEAKKVGVVDNSGIVYSHLISNDEIAYEDLTGQDPEMLKKDMGKLGIDVLLLVSEIDKTANTLNAETYSKKPIGVEMENSIARKINDAVEEYKVDSYKINNLKEIMSDVKSDIKLDTYNLDDTGKASIVENDVYMFISMALAFCIYMFIAMFGGMVMTSVIEEKSSRIVEVLISSVKSTELMFGKIIGVALVALTQFFLWIVLTAVILSVAGGIMGYDQLGKAATADPSVQVTQAMGGNDIMTMPDLNAVADNADVPGKGMSTVITTLKNVDYGKIGICFIIYFIFGYLLYSSMFAAIGSAVENETDTHQLQLPVTIPLMIGFFIAFYAFKAPESPVVFWGSLIPFTSPIVMLARIPFGVPMWQLALSVGLLAGTFVLCAWASAKIYNVGVLMFGKKSTFNDLWKWLKQK